MFRRYFRWEGDAMNWCTPSHDNQQNTLTKNRKTQANAAHIPDKEVLIKSPLVETSTGGDPEAPERESVTGKKRAHVSKPKRVHHEFTHF